MITGLIEFANLSISLTDDVHHITKGDTVRMQMQDRVYGLVAWVTLTVVSVEVKTNTMTPHYIVSFSRATNYDPFNGAKFRVYRNNGAPYASIDGTISAVDPILTKYLALEDGTRYFVDLGSPEVFAIGEAVYRGDPLDPSVALVYDDITRPDWYKYRTQDFQSNLRGSVQFATGLLGSGYATVQPNGEDYAYVTLSPAPVTTLQRGTRLEVTLDVDASKHTFEVGGEGANQGEYYAKGNITGNRLVSGSVNILQPIQPNAEYLEVSPGTGYLPSVAVAAPVLVGSTFLSVGDTTSFPYRGRCQVTMLDGPGGSPGSTLEFAYDGKSPFELHNLKWGSVASPEDETYVAYAPSVRIGSVVTLVGRFADSMINPAFHALVRARTSRIGSTTPAGVTAENAAGLYALLKGTSTIIETSVMAHPDPMLQAIAEATPVGSTTIIFGRQAFSDSVDLSPSDSSAVFQTPSVDIIVAAPTDLPVDSGNIPVIWLPPDMMSVGLGSDLMLGLLPVPPGKLGGTFTYKWTVTEEVSVVTPVSFSDPTQQTLRIDFNDTQSIVYVKLKVTHPITGTTVSSVVRVRRFNAPVISVLVTNPTNGLGYPNNDWDVPSPAPSIDLSALLDPAVPSAAIGPYTFAWSVVDEFPNPAPTIVNGTTATPTFTGVAANARLKVTLTVTATGIPVSMTRAFTKVFYVRLV